MPHIDIDIAARGPLRLGIDDGRTVWLATPGAVIRVRGRDLRQVVRQAARVRDEHPGIDVLVDIDVVIAEDAPTALTAAADLSDTDTLRYAGTIRGLAGLIADLHTLAITDGAMLLPAKDIGQLALVKDRILTELQSLVPAAFSHARPA